VNTKKIKTHKARKIFSSNLRLIHYY